MITPLRRPRVRPVWRRGARMAALAAGTAALAGLLWAVAASAPAPGQAWWLLVWELAHEVATWTVAGLGRGALGWVLWSALPRRRAASAQKRKKIPGVSR